MKSIALKKKNFSLGKKYAALFAVLFLGSLMVFF